MNEKRILQQLQGTEAEWLEQAGLPYEARPESLAGFSQYVLDLDKNIIEFDAAYGS